MTLLNPMVYSPALRLPPPLRRLAYTNAVTSNFRSQHRNDYTCICHCRYLNAAGAPVVSETYSSAAMMTWKGKDGLEEMHMFAGIAWWDMPSWVWVHHIVEWATKGVFMVRERSSNSVGRGL